MNGTVFPNEKGGDMEISGELLLLYIALWCLAWFLLTKIIAERSVQAWIDRFDQDKNPAGADLIVHLLEPVLDEIRSDQGDTLKDLRLSFLICSSASQGS